MMKHMIFDYNKTNHIAILHNLTNFVVAILVKKLLFYKPICT